MPNAPIIKFDFRHYIPDQDLSANTVVLDKSICGGESFVASILAENLTPGHLYRTDYELISPSTEDNVFNPQSSSLYASYGAQNFVTAVKLPPGPNEVNSYILKATVIDLSDEGGSVQSSTQITLICGLERPIFKPEILDPDLQPVPPDNIIDIENCDNAFPMVCVIKDAVPGKLYDYEFFGNPADGIVFENKNGSIYAGDVNQNFNAKVSLTTYPYVFVHTSVTEKDTGIRRNSQSVLLKCYQTNPCDVVLPTGVDVSVGVPAFRRCANRGLSNNSISLLYGGKGFSIGDRLTTTGGGGYGAEIDLLFGGITQETFSTFVGGSGYNIGDLIEVTGGGGTDALIKITSGGLTDSSINSLTGCSNFKVGDLLTVVGGGGSDAIISVSATGTNGSITSYSVVNHGNGYTNAPTGVRTISGNGSCVSASFNDDNFTIPCVGSITYSSSSIYGGDGYNIGEILDIVGGGGSGAQVQFLTGSLTASSISISGGSGYAVGDYLSTTGGNGKDVVISVASTGTSGSIAAVSVSNGGYGFISAPTGLSRLTGSGTGASLTANANNFSITYNGSITKQSISNLINSGLGYSVGDQLIALGASGSGGVLEIISVGHNGQITDYIVKYAGYGYSGFPQLINEDNVAISNQPLWNISNFTDNSYAIINGGCNYQGNPSSLSSVNGDGSGAVFGFDSSKFSGYAFIVVNAGSGYTESPTGIVVRSGDGAGASASFNDSNFTIPCADGITYGSVSGLIGQSPFLPGEELIVDGVDGSGGRLKIIGVSNIGEVTSFVVLSGGCGYISEPTLKRLNGLAVSGVAFDVESFTESAVALSSPGYGFSEAPTGLQTLTGTGDTSDIVVVFNSNNFVDIIGPDPTPSSTPTPTVTPSQSEPAKCNELQTAGGQNTNYITKVAETANIGQNYLIVEDTSVLQNFSVIVCDSVSSALADGTYITNTESWFANVVNRTKYKKITLSNNLTSPIPNDTEITVYVADNRLIKVPYWPGTMNFIYDAYNIPDRFRVFAVPVDSRLQDILLFDSGYRGSYGCGYVSELSGPGFGNVTINKPDGCIFIRVVVEAPCGSTAWEYSLSCPTRTFTTITSTPTPTPTVTPSSSPTNP